MPSMPSVPKFFRGRSSSKSERYENVEAQANEDTGGIASYWTETYNGGVAPVTISVDEQDESAAIEPKKSRSWKQRKPMSYFADKEGGDVKNEETPPPSCIETKDKVEAPSDLDVCCIQDGALGCLNFENMVLCSKEEDAKKQYTQVANSTHGKDDDNSSYPDICPVKSADESTIGTGGSCSQQVDKFRSMGAIRDKKEGNVLTYYLTFCKPAPTDEKGGFLKDRLRLVLAAVTLLLIVIISIIVGVTLSRQRRNKRPNGPNFMIGNNPDREAEIKSILDQTPDSVWETEGSPQIKALEWLIYRDPLEPSLRTNEEIQERFAAATLYHSTNGLGWKAPLGFLGENSICEWNFETNNNESVGIFCKNGRVSEINIVNHNLSGSLTSDLNYFSQVVVLNLYFNKLTGPIPDLSSLTMLEQLDLDDNKLSGSVPESIFKLPSLANLFLLFNQGLTGNIPEIEETSRLVGISLLGCSFSGTIPKSLGKLSSLRLLQLKGNNLGGGIPQKLLSSTSLQTIGLEGNQLSGTIPPVMVSDTGSKLTSLSLGDNLLEGPLPYGMDDLTNLQYLSAENNQLTGSIRNAIMDLPNLEKLYLHGNNLSGDLSYFLSESKVLSELYLGDNDFSGDLNDFLAFAPPSLEHLDLSYNRGLEGYMSEDIGNFASLTYFNVSGCGFESTIPTEIGRLKSLETMDLSWNDFQGDVPAELENMESLLTFDISRNRDLEGDLSSTFCEERFDFVYALADCTGDIRVFCDCCTHCCNREGICGPNNNV